MRKVGSLVVLTAVMLVAASIAGATVYEIGPGKTYTNIGDMPWESLVAGDTVNIYYRATPYKEKIALGAVGTEGQPILIHGVPGPGGELPVLDGQDATTRLEWITGSEARGIITMQQDTVVPAPCRPAWITIENLEFKGASYPYTFTDDAGLIQSYSYSAAGIWITDGRNITVRNCYFHDCGNGFFTYTEDDGTMCWTQDILVEGCWLTACGYAGRNTEHDSYTESYKITFQYNRYGPPRGGDTNPIGNALKDRSAGMVVRYNWIEGGNRTLDMVEPEDSDTLGNDPLNHVSFVYGNVLIERNDAGNRQIMHYGGDMHGVFRAGWLYCYNNTIVSYRTVSTVLIRPSTDDESVDFRNNIFYAIAAPATTMSWIERDGRLDISHCWYQAGIKDAPAGMSGIINNDGTSIVGTSPGFANEAGQDFTLAAGSACINAAGPLAAGASAYPVTMQYVLHQAGETRPNDGQMDIGAFEAAGGPPANLVITTTSVPNGTVGTAYSQALVATGGVPAYTWSLAGGSLPAGLSLSSAGVISGTPTTAQTANFTVQVADSQQPADTDTQALSITIAAAPVAPTILTASLPNGTRAVPYSAAVEATGGTLPYTWSIVLGSLPTGLSLNPSTGVISGTPTKKGTKTFTVRCTDAAAQYDDQALAITIY